MKTLVRALPAFFAGLGLMLLAVPAASAASPLDQVREVLSPFAGQLEMDWRDGALVLDGQLDEEQIDKVVVEAARVDGVDVIVNELYI